MTLCETIASLVDLVMLEHPAAAEEDRNWAGHIRSIGTHRDQQGLDEWERRCDDSSPSNRNTPLREMLTELQMLGMCNLHQRFNERRTTEFYNRLVPFFAERGVRIPTEVELEDW